MRDFAEQIYGPDKAAKIAVEVWEECDTEMYSSPIGDFVAHDKSGNELLPDFSLPFFQTSEWQQFADSWCHGEKSTIQDFLDLHGSYKNSLRKSWIIVDDLPAVDASYDLTTEPTLSLPKEVLSS